MQKITLKIVANSVSMAAGVLFTLLLVMTVFRQDLLDFIGTGIITYTVNNYREAADNASNQIARGDIDSAMKSLEEEPWQALLPGDRGWVYITAINRKLADVLYRQGLYEKLFELSKVWHKHNDRDLAARAYLYESIRHLPGREEEGRAALKREFGKFPTHRIIARFNSYAQMSSGEITTRTMPSYRQVVKKIIDGWELELRWRAEHTTLVQNLIEHYDDNRWSEIWKSLKEIWKFYFVWKENKELYEKKQIREFSIQPDADGINTIVMSVDPVITTTLRIDPPSHSMLTISGIKLRINDQPMELTEGMFEYANMYERDGYIWQTGMNKPRFYLKVAGLLGNIAQTKVPIELEFKAFLFDEMGNTRLLTRNIIDEIVNSAE